MYPFSASSSTAVYPNTYMQQQTNDHSPRHHFQQEQHQQQLLQQQQQQQQLKGSVQHFQPPLSQNQIQGPAVSAGHPSQLNILSAQPTRE